LQLNQDQDETCLLNDSDDNSSDSDNDAQDYLGGVYDSP